MSAPTIPFGPGVDPLGLLDTDFEFVSLDGPQIAIENETPSYQADGAFLRVAATREKHSFTANYTILAADAVLPEEGLYDASSKPLARKCWISSVNVSKPQQGDQTMAVAYYYYGDVVATEGLAADFAAASSSGV